MGGHFRGVPLQDNAFTIDRHRKAEPAIGGSAIEAKWNYTAAKRNERFEATLYALDRLIAWSKSERHEFLHKIFGIAPVRSLGPVQQFDGLPDVAELDINLEAKDEGEDLECADDEHDGGSDIVCSFAPKRVKGKDDDLPANPVANLADSDFVSKASDIYQAALSLADSIEKNGTRCRRGYCCRNGVQRAT